MLCLQLNSARIFQISFPFKISILFQYLTHHFGHIQYFFKILKTDFEIQCFFNTSNQRGNPDKQTRAMHTMLPTPSLRHLHIWTCTALGMDQLGRWYGWEEGLSPGKPDEDEFCSCSDTKYSNCPSAGRMHDFALVFLESIGFFENSNKFQFLL